MTRRRAVGAWLALCCCLLFLLILVGGVTRLTQSGLSITEWEPVVGALPPLGEAQWAEAFAKYQRSPEYLQINRGMSLGQFQRIFWWEYAHRLLARVLGATYLLPLLWFLVRREIGGALAWRLVGVFLLGGAQGALGWLMVASGLVDEPRVSHLRLAAHLGMALAILGAMFWLALGQLRGPSTARPPSAPGLARLAGGFAGLVFVQAISGAMVAGTHAGLLYGTFPLMAGSLIPAGLLRLEPWFRNPLYNLATIHFQHRGIAWILLAAACAFRWRARTTLGEGDPLRAANLLLAAVLLQFALGVATVLAGVPATLGVLHQGGAVLLFVAALNAWHSCRRAAVA
ncbi:MAG: COX15/CtaA family protein [Thermoanaerobaculia bacterium]